MMSMNEFRVQCEICGKRFRTVQGLRGHEMLKCKAEDSASTTEEDLDTVQVSERVLAFYNYARNKGYEGTMKKFLDETVTLFFNMYARQKGIRLIMAEGVD